MEYSRKRLSLIPVERNTPGLIEKRKLFARHVNVLSNSQLLYLDECGFNSHTSRHYGYSQKNQKAIKHISGSKGRNVSIVCIISEKGVISFEIIQDSVNGMILNNLLNEKLERFLK